MERATQQWIESEKQRQTYTVQSLLYDLSQLRQSKARNDTFSTVIQLQRTAEQSAGQARERIMEHALLLLSVPFDWKE